MKVLSLFDGMSCGRVALERAGLPVTSYFASELDKHAITIAQKNYPTTVQLGDVRLVREMAEAGFFGRIDLLIGGSPCQGFSFSGKQLAFDDPRSVLFFEFVRILRALQKDNSDIKFMLENVKMKKEHLNVITSFLGVNPVFINSALVSAQNRQRYYWANWPISQPADRGILLKDIIETGGAVHGYFEPKEKKSNINSVCKSVGLAHGEGNEMPRRVYDTNFKSPTLIAQPGGGAYPPKIIGGAVRGRYEPDGSTSQPLELNNTPKANALTSVQKDSVLSNGITYRKLTPVECERLQTLPDNYTAGVSDTQRYKMLGNGWTVEIVAHILKGLTV